MKTYFLKRLQVFAGLAFSLVIVLTALGLFDPNSRAELMPIVVLGAWLAPLMFMHANWFLTLPFSRHRLLAYHGLETLALSGVSIVALICYCLVLNRLQPEAQVYKFLPAGLAMFAFTIPFRFLFVVRAAKLNVLRLNVFSSRRFFFWMLLMTFGAFASLKVSREGYILCAIFVAGLSMLPLMSLASIRMPRDTFAKYRRGLAFSGLGVYILIAVGAVVVIESHQASGDLVDTAMAFVGHIPIPVSEARAHELLTDDRVTVEPLSLSLALNYKASISQDEWFHRATHCTSAGCLDLTDVLAPEPKTPTQALDQFKALMQPCDLKLHDEGRLSCTNGIKLSARRLEKRLQAFVDDGAADTWLSDENVRQQAIAMRALSKSASDETRSARVKQLLSESKDETVRAAAERFLSGRAAKVRSVADLF